MDRDPTAPDPRPWFREVAVPAAVTADLATAWVVDSDAEHALVPDACVDVVWLADGSVWVCGPETRGWTFRVPGGREAVGIRFRPGHASAALGVGMDELREQRVPLRDVVGRDGERLADRLHAATGPAARVRLLHGAAAGWASSGREPDVVADRIARRLSDDPALTATGLARELGLSDRQLLRRASIAFGYGPATLRRVLRLQRFLALARGRRHAGRLTALALAAGYADQQHLARDARDIARATPSALLRSDHADPATSDPSTTPPAGAARLG